MIYDDFESILVPEYNGKQDPDESYTTKYQNHVGCSFGYILVSVNDQFSKPFKSYSGQDAVYKFITSMVKKSKYCSRVIKKYFNLELVMTKKDDENFESFAKEWLCGDTFVESDLKVRNHCHVTEKKVLHTNTVISTSV